MSKVKILLQNGSEEPEVIEDNFLLFQLKDLGSSVRICTTGNYSPICLAAVRQKVNNMYDGMCHDFVKKFGNPPDLAAALRLLESGKFSENLDPDLN